MPTKAQLEEQNAELQAQIAEAKRQSTQVPVTVGAEPDSGSHAIDHLTLLEITKHQIPTKSPRKTSTNVTMLICHSGTTAGHGSKQLTATVTSHKTNGSSIQPPSSLVR